MKQSEKRAIYESDIKGQLIRDLSNIRNNTFHRLGKLTEIELEEEYIKRYEQSENASNDREYESLEILKECIVFLLSRKDIDVSHGDVSITFKYIS